MSAHIRIAPAALLSPLLLLAACMVGPDYARPSVKVAAAFAPTAQTATPDTAGLAHWWTGLHDPILDQLIDQALRENLDLEIAAARIDQAGASLGVARSALLPSGDVSASAGRSRESIAAAPGAFLQQLPSGFPRDQNSFIVNTEASWEIDLFGGARRGTEAARADLAGAVADAQATRVAIVGQVVDTYVQVRRIQAESALIKAQLADQRRSAALDRLLADRGITPRTELRRSESNLAAAEPRLPALSADLTSKMNAIDILLGDAPGTHRALLTPPADALASPGNTAAGMAALNTIPDPGAPVDLLRRRPDVIAAEARLRAANARIGQAIGEYYPKITLSGMLGASSLTTGSLLTGRGFQTQATAGLRWRIFDFMRLDAELRQARGQYREQLGAYRASVLKAAADVEDAVADVQAADAALSQREQQVGLQNGINAAAARSFAQGATSEKDRLSVEQASLGIDIGLVDARADRAQASARLYRVLGGGWAVAPSGTGRT